jgi:drug/metabolite transporter (DMT)-like permease
MKIGLGYAQPFAFAALRTFLGALSLFVLLIVLRRSLRPRAIGSTIVIGLLQTTGFVGMLMWALQSGGAGKTSVLTYTMPFWLLLLAWAFLDERVRGTQWLAVGLALAGLLLVLSPWRLQGVFSSLLAVAAGVSWAASAIVVKRLQKRQDVDLLSLTTWQMLFGSLPLILIALLTGHGGPEWSAPFVWALAYNVLLGNALAWLLWLYALRKLSAGAAGLGTLATPVIGVTAAWLQLGERPTEGEAAGMALIIAALAIITVRGLVLGRRERDAQRDQTALTQAPP